MYGNNVKIFTRGASLPGPMDSLQPIHPTASNSIRKKLTSFSNHEIGLQLEISVKKCLMQVWQSTSVLEEMLFIFNFRLFVLEKTNFLVSLGSFFNPSLLNPVNVDLLLVKI